MDPLEQPSMAGHGVEIAVDFQVMLENGVKLKTHTEMQ